MAHGGWKQPQQLLALSWILALGGELDVLINVDGFNEVALDGVENAERGVFPAPASAPTKATPTATHFVTTCIIFLPPG